MACVLALVADLLFGSRLQGALERAGHDVELIATESLLRKRLTDAHTATERVLIVDLTNPEIEGARIVEELEAEGALEKTRTVGFFAHVDVSARERAEGAGFDLLVPRSRIAREGPELLARLLAGG